MYAFCFLPGLILVFHIIKKATPIKMYKVVQTGPNTQPGGLNVGLANVVNQSFREEDVKYPPIAPTASGTAIEIINWRKGKGFFGPGSVSSVFT